ncbi:MAG: hypothetical protein GX260_03305 [Tissierellia bacterium]|nr:hypothetical protein [Bacillota bacterium]NLL22794.1 hypothetical protein [Tissierellia bacterium]
MSLKISDEQRLFISKNVPEIDMESNDLNDILRPLDIFISDIGLDDNYELTDLGRKAQRIYDDIYLNN